MTIISKYGGKSYDFDIAGIIGIFQEQDAAAQEEYLRGKLDELIVVEDLELNLFNRLKRNYLLQWRYIGLILQGLLYQAEKDLGYR
ncbi:MAG: hypothetical protein KAW12_06100 [Candidatus Aminicenantes bacterium]|nr:hypothetical protein [Candidatus Aminicenantes bacterium]